MANVLVQESSLQDIADSIRGKLGVQTTYKPSEMADAIDSISGGGITPTGTIEITQNGVVDVTNYASADVDVPTGGGNQVVETVLVESSTGDISILDFCDGSYSLKHTDGLLIIRASGTTAPANGSYTINNYFVPYKNQAEFSTNQRRHHYQNGKQTPNSFNMVETSQATPSAMISNGTLNTAATTASPMGGVGTKITVFDIPVDWSAFGIS